MDDQRYDSKDGIGTTTWKWEVRNHGWLKVEQCRSNCRELRRDAYMDVGK